MWAQIDKYDFDKYSEITEEQIENLYDKLAEIETKHPRESIETFNEYSITQIASVIEHRIKSKLKCTLCKKIFDENTHKVDIFEGTEFKARPCYSTFVICKQSACLLNEEILKGDIDLKIIQNEIFVVLKFSSLYDLTDFTEHLDHKEYIVRYIIDEFIRIKATNIAKKATFKEHEKSLRVKVHKLVHYLGH